VGFFLLFVFLFVFVGLRFELRALSMQSRHSQKPGTLPLEPQLQSISSGYFEDGGLKNYLPELASNLDPSNLSFPNI
jgi:hypothetical protein